MMRITCCKSCQGRYPGCHSECESYIEERKKLDKFNEKKRHENQARMYNNSQRKHVRSDY